MMNVFMSSKSSFDKYKKSSKGNTKLGLEFSMEKYQSSSPRQKKIKNQQQLIAASVAANEVNAIKIVFHLISLSCHNSE